MSAKLTEAQREALRKLHVVNGSAREDAICSKSIGIALREKGLVNRYPKKYGRGGVMRLQITDEGRAAFDPRWFTCTDCGQDTRHEHVHRCPKRVFGSGPYRDASRVVLNEKGEKS